jgi:hypothetical protein
MTLNEGAAPPIDLKIIEQTLIDKCGCVAAAARDLGMPSGDLRRLVGSRPMLADAVYEGVERALDAAVQTLLNGLDHQNPMMRLRAASYFMRLSEAGRRRGWGAAARGVTRRSGI